MLGKEQRISSGKKESVVIEKWEYFLISMLGVIFCGFAIALFSMSKNTSDLLVSGRTLKKTLSNAEKSFKAEIIRLSAFML